jgi:hypothetical protein
MFALGMSARLSLEEFLEDPALLSTDELERGFSQLQRLAEAVEARRLRWQGELQRRRSWRRDGFVSGDAWLAERFGLSGSAARDQLKVASALEAMPQARRALEEGDLTSSAVRVLVEARQGHPDAYRSQEVDLVEAARPKSVDELRRAMGEWSQAVDIQEGADATERLREQRHLTVCATAQGMLRVSGELDPESGEALTTAIQAVVDADLRSGGPVDLRTPGQRWADALVEVARRSLDAADRPTVAGERPHITVTVDLGVLQGEAGVGRLDHAGLVGAEAVRRLACDASVSRVVLAGASEPVDIGRRTPVVPPSLRRAVVLRDDSCRFPGCRRPQAWCDAHHVKHWADGGTTSLSNLVLLCRPHHRLVHEGGFTARMAGDQPVFRRGDGSTLQDGRGPPSEGS